MGTPVQNPQDNCSVCGASLSASLRHCPTCSGDAGAPNVRRCRTVENEEALKTEFAAAREKAEKNRCLHEFEALSILLAQQSGVVISMPAGVARKLLEDPKDLYTNYKQLLGAQARKPALPENDRHRCAVGAALFGSYAESIVYGALSLTTDGLPTYGAVYCRLRSVTIDKRISFLETNSYKFVSTHGLVGGKDIPAGCMACWEQRHLLALVKMADQLAPGQGSGDWQAILIQSDGQKRENDEFVEAHIFEGFDRNAIESLAPVLGKKLRREEQLDLEIAISKFKQIGGQAR